MKLHFSAIALACAVAAGSVAYAAPMNSQNSSSAADQAQMQAQLTQLQNQLNQLNSQLANKNKIISSPELGRTSAIYEKGRKLVEDDSGDYFEMMPSTTFELGMLQARDKFANGTLAVGGYIENDLQYWDQQNISSTPQLADEGSQVALTTLNVDLASNLNDWVQAFASAHMVNIASSNPNAAPSPGEQVNKAFVTIGNLDKTPFYITVGQVYVPFGVFGGNGPWSAELPRAYFRSNEIPQVILGFFQDGLETSLSIFNDSTKDQFANFAYNVNYTATINSAWNYNVGVSYVNNVLGMSGGQAVGGSNGLQTNHGVNPAGDINAELNYLIYSVSTEYVQTLKDNYNAHSTDIGKTRSWYLGVSASPTLLGKTTVFNATYAGASGINGVAVGLNNSIVNGTVANYGIKQEWIFGASQYVLKNVILGLEYQRARTYDNRNANVYTLDSSVYF